MKLNEICSKGKSSLRQKDVINDGPYSVYGASGVVGTTSDYQNEIPYVAVIKDGAGVGRASACEPMTSVLGTMQALIPNPNVERDYLLYLVRSLRLGEGFSGSTIPHIYFKDYGKIEVPLPSLEAQKRIVSQLGLIEAQIEQAEAQTTQLDQLVKSRFIEMFGDPIRNEKGLPFATVEELAAHSKHSMKAGPFGSSLKKSCYVEAGYKIYGQEQVISGDENYGDYYIDSDKYQELCSCHVEPGDVLISLVGTVGKVLVLSQNCPEGIINPRLVKITFDRLKMEPDFFSVLFTLESVHDTLLDGAHGQTMSVLNLGMIKKLQVAVPPIEQQRDYLAFVQQVDKSRFATHYDHLRASY